MSTFILAISCLTTFSLPWFMDLPFHGPVQYCSLQHQTLVPSPVISTTGCCFGFGFVFSSFLELFLHSSLGGNILGTYRPGEFMFQCYIFLPFHTVRGVLKQEYWSGCMIPWRRDRLSTPVFWGFPAGSDGKESTCNEGALGLIMGWEDPLEEDMANHSMILAWRIPINRGAWWGCKVLDMTEWLSTEQQVLFSE